MASSAQTPTATTLYSGTHCTLEQQKKSRGKFTKCQVLGCNNSVEDKAYYRKYKICFYHCSQSSIELNGVMLRWCQQCGRFQPLADFEGDRKTCKEKLDLHNSRRRKARSRLEGNNGTSSVQESAKQKSHQTLSSTQVLSCSFGPAADHGRGPSSAQLRGTAFGHAPQHGTASPDALTLSRKEGETLSDSVHRLRGVGTGALPSWVQEQQLQHFQPESPSQRTATQLHASFCSESEVGQQQLVQLLAQNMPQRARLQEMLPLHRLHDLLALASSDERHFGLQSPESKAVPNLHAVLAHLSEASGMASGLPLFQMAQQRVLDAQEHTHSTTGHGLDVSKVQQLVELIQGLSNDAANQATMLDRSQSDDDKSAGHPVSKQHQIAWAAQNEYGADLAPLAQWLSQRMQGGQEPHMQAQIDGRYRREGQSHCREALPANALASLPSLLASVSGGGLQQLISPQQTLPGPPSANDQVVALLAQLQQHLMDTSWQQQGQDAASQRVAGQLAKLLTAQPMPPGVGNGPAKEMFIAPAAPAPHALLAAAEQSMPSALQQLNHWSDMSYSGPPLARSFWSAFTSTEQQQAAVQDNWQSVWDAQNMLAGLAGAGSQGLGVHSTAAALEALPRATTIGSMGGLSSGTKSTMETRSEDVGSRKPAEPEDSEEEAEKGMSGLPLGESTDSGPRVEPAIPADGNEAFLEEASFRLFKAHPKDLSPEVYEALRRLAKAAAKA